MSAAIRCIHDPKIGASSCPPSVTDTRHVEVTRIVLLATEERTSPVAAPRHIAIAAGGMKGVPERSEGSAGRECGGGSAGTGEGLAAAGPKPGFRALAVQMAAGNDLVNIPVRIMKLFHLFRRKRFGKHVG